MLIRLHEWSHMDTEVPPFLIDMIAEKTSFVATFNSLLALGNILHFF